ncbi:protocadherin Fat 4-like [Gigantopelta aegis]|uniref:protocadherin Fat 4-like n=1 Tax=Gigantopelta aegis TaxID=1735272 RepID=UPI001B88C15D|nr:protocadherin Fat 4-like [Gigantopelta aegis]
MLRDATCGGKCNSTLSETEPCNRQCCPENCKYSPWGPWNCYCTGTQCKEPGERNSCTRIRQQITFPKCGGYCGYNTIEENCDVLCCFRDCILGIWSPWSFCEAQCEQQGIQTRKRSIQQHGRCGGKLCKVVVESKDCTGMCCPVDCVQGEWSSWSLCDATCGLGNQTRTRFVDLPKCYGKACEEPVSTHYKKCERYVNVDCEISQWAVWSDCKLTNGFCGNGTRSRQRQILVDVKCRGKPCPNLTEEQDCQGPCCRQDCELSAWTEWSFCSTDCGKGISERNRTVTTPPACNGTECSKLLEKRECTMTDKRDCIFTTWSEWTLCNNDCGVGNSTRSRTILTPAYCGGQCSDHSVEEVKECQSYSARTDCKLSQWSEWSVCVRDCEEGIQRRNRTILVHDVCGGVPCAGVELDISINATDIHESWPIGTCFAALTTKTDNEPNDRHTYKILSDATHSLSLDGNRVCLKKEVSFEKVVYNPFTVIIQTEDLDKEKADETFQFTILNENDPPRGIVLTPNFIDENSKKGQRVGCLQVLDDDLGQTHKIFMVRSAERNFELFDEGDKKCVKVAVESDPRCETIGNMYCALDYETMENYYITVLVQDNGVPPLMAVFDVPIKLHDVNEKPWGITLKPENIPEEVDAGKPLAKIIVQDEKDQKHTLEIVSDSSKLFRIINGHLVASEKIDFEKEPKRKFTLKIKVIDNGIGYLMNVLEVVFGIQDVNENPYDLHVTSDNSQLTFDTDSPKLKENTKDEVFATVTVYDDDKGDVIEMTVEPSEYFKINNKRCSALQEVTNNYCKADLVVTTAFNYEKTKRLKMTVSAKDKEGLQVNRTVTLTIIDTNDKPTDILINGKSSSELNVAENSKLVTVATLHAVDEDVTDTHKYHLTGSGASQFFIQDNQIKTTATAVLDYEAGKQLELIVTVEDSGNPPLKFQKTLSVKVTNVNEAPTDITLNNNKVLENSNAGTLVGSLSAGDPDNINEKTQTITFSLIDDSKGRFVIKGDNLQIAKSSIHCGTELCSLNYLKEPELQVVVRATDDGTPQLHADKLLIIKLEDVNDAPENIRLSSNTIRENLAPNTVIGSLSAEDRDINQIITFTLLDQTHLFSIQGKQELLSQKTFNFEENSKYSITVMATDNGQPQASTKSVIEVIITDMNEAPTFVGTQELTVSENIPVGSVIDKLTVQDPDHRDAMSLTLSKFDHMFNLDAGNCTDSKSQTGGTICVFELKTKVLLDYNKVSLYSLTVLAEDRMGLVVKNTYTVTVKNVNHPPEDILLDNLPMAEIYVDENVSGVEIASLSAKDKDKEQMHTFSIKSQDDNLFGINKTHLKVPSVYILLKPLDYEKIQQVTVELTATDPGSLTVDKNITVFVKNINEAPTEVLLSGNEVKENSGVDTIIGTLTTQDPDNTNTVTQTFTYTLLNNAENRFKTDGDKLVVGNAGKGCNSNGGDMCLLNFEKTKKHSIDILVSDNGVPSKTARFSFSVVVTDDNDAPQNIKLSNNKVEELASSGTVVGNLSVHDEDVGQTHKFTLLDNGVDHFSLTPEGVLTKATDTRLDSKLTYKIAIRATDSGAVPKHVDATFYIAVTGTEEAPKDITISPTGQDSQFPDNTPEIREDAVVGDIVGVISAVDMDADEQITFSILDDGDGHFNTNGTANCLPKGTGTMCTTSLLLSSPLDFEQEQTFTIVIRAADKNGLQLTESFTVHVTDVNEAPTDLSFSGGKIVVKENSKGEEIGTFLATDPDVKSSLTFSLTTGYPGLLLANNGFLSTAQDADINFESKADIQLKVKVTDQGGLFFEKVFPVHVEDVNEAPTKVTLSNNTVVEMSPSGIEIGQLIASDPDKNQILTFSLQDDVGGRFKIEGNYLKTADTGLHCLEKGGANCLLDYETSKSHNIAVKVSDNGSPPLSITAVLTVIVQDDNDPPSAPVIDSTEISESASVGTLVGSLESEDQDPGQTVTFSLAEDVESNEWFTITGNKLKLKKMVDFEDTKTLIAKVIATDSGESPLTSEKAFVIRVKDEDEKPSSLNIESIRGENHLTFPVDQPVIKENEPDGTVIGQIVVIDPDFKEDISAATSNSLVGLESMSCLTLTKGSRCVAELKTQRVFDFETKSTFSFDVTVTDKAGLQLKKIFNLTVQDENDPPHDILVNGKSDGLISVDENSADITVAQMNAVDSDSGQQHTFTLVDGPQLFYFVADSLKITSAAQLDYETNPEYIIVVKVTDNGQPPLSTQKQMVVMVKDVNEKPVSVHLTSNMIAEASTPDTLVGHLVTVDPDNVNSIRQNFTYSLTNSDEGRFKIREDQLLVKDPKFDFDVKQTSLVKVKVTDNGLPPLSAEFELEIIITNSNDPPTNLQLSANTVPEDATVGTMVGLLSADDDDRDQTISFSMMANPFLTVRDNRLVVSGQLDFETVPNIKVNITAQDSAVPPLKIWKEFLIKVMDTNDRPSALELVSPSGSTQLSVAEGTKTDTLLGTVTVSDPDRLERITLHLLPSGSQQLKLAAGGPVCQLKEIDGLTQTVCTSDLLLAAPVNFEEQAGKPLVAEVQATDKGRLTITDRWEITVTDTNDPPTDITIDGDITEIPENEVGFLIGTLETEDEDRQDKHTYQLITFWEIFKVQAGGKLVCLKSLDYEQKKEYAVTIKTTDNGSPSLSATKTFYFSVKNINEKPTQISLSPNEVSMAAQPGSTVGFLEVTDPDNKVDKQQTFRCSVSDKEERFVVNQTNLAIQVDGSLPNNETVLPVSVTCTDSGQPPLSMSQSIAIHIKLKADVPKVIKLLGNHQVVENQADALVGKLAVVNALNQQEIKGEFKFKVLDSVEKTKEAATMFVIDGMSLKVTKPLDFEEKGEWMVTIKVTGKYGENQPVDAQDEFTINVIDVNEAPTHIGLYTSSVPENSPPGTVIGDLNTVDSEKDQTYIYTLMAVAKGVQVTDPDKELLQLFHIRNRSLIIGEASQFLNYEISDVFTLKIRTMDSGSPPLTYVGTVHVLVKDRNDPPSNITLDNTKIVENSAEGSVVGSLSVEDEDKNQTHTCEVINIQQVPFKVIDGLKLVVSRDELDYEGARKYVAEISCQDEGADGSFLKITKPITIDVTNVNEAPYNISLSKLKIKENSIIGQTVAEINSVDPDSDKVTYKINNDTMFAIEGDNTLTANKVFDYELLQSAQFTITATDPEGLSASQTFTIEVEDMNEPPSRLTLSANTVQENSPPGTEIGILRTEDADRGQTFTYSLTQMETDKGYFAIKENRLVTGSTPLDYETKSEYNISITTSDSGTPPLGKTEEFTVEVKDINEAPTKIITDNIESIPENTTVGFVVSTLHVEDDDVDQKHSCHVKDDRSPFVVKAEENSMALVLADMLDFEKTSQHKIELSCSDGQFDVSKVVTITVEDVNEKPTAIKLDAPLVLPAMGKAGFVIGNLTVEDPDRGQTHTFNTQGPNSDLIQVKNKNTLTLIKPIPTAQMDKPNPELKISIKVTDNGQPSLSLEEIFTFPITGIDLKALQLPDITISDTRIKEDAPVGTVIGALYNVNQTLGENIVFKITDDDLDLFEIKNNSQLVLAQSFDSVTSHSVMVTIQAKNMQTQQVSSRKITILIIRSVRCMRADTGCGANAKCVKQNETFEFCQCLESFVGDGYNCTDVDDCKERKQNDTCQNRGKCVDEVGGFSCKCEGFSGPRCEIDNSQNNICAHVSCLNNGVCTQDNTTSEGYKCVCKVGWTGKVCDLSVDDCVKSVCFAGGSCIDKHRTYICRCPPGRSGIHCEYITKSCSHSSCSSSELCVPKVDQEDKSCVEEKTCIVVLKFNLGKVDVDEFKARFMDFVSSYGRFPTFASAGSQSTTSRRKRSSDTNKHPRVYVQSVTQPSNGKLKVSFVVMDSQDVGYTVKEVLTSLEKTCASIDSADDPESLFCPAIQEAVLKQPVPGGGEEGGGLPLPMIAGGAGGGVLVIIIIIIVVVCIKKKKKDSDQSSKTESQQDESNHTTGNSVPPASLPPPPPPLPVS